MKKFTFADLKRRLQVGVKLKLVAHDWIARGLKMGYLEIGMVRKIYKINGGAMGDKISINLSESNRDYPIMFSFRVNPERVRIDEKGFDVSINPNNPDGQFQDIIRYEFVD